MRAVTVVVVAVVLLIHWIIEVSRFVFIGGGDGAGGTGGGDVSGCGGGVVDVCWQL